MTKPTDYPIETCARDVKPYVEAGCHFHQKWTCAKCRSRQTMDDEDIFHATGRCEACGYITDITVTGCNYMLHGPTEVIMNVRRANAQVPHVIRAEAFANGVPCPIAGQWLKSFDFEYDNGRGDGTFTNDPRKAMVFESQRHAEDYWNTVPKCRPYRTDGLPNKPLTSTTCVIEPRELAIKEWRRK